MDINRNNYEAFLLDLLEGRLSVEEERELNEFLKHHPEHVMDLPDTELWRLEKSHVSFPARDRLKKEFPVADTRLSVANFDLFSIARMEGDLTPQQEEEHRSMVSRDQRKEEEWSVWQKARLVPEKIQFHGKKSLKRKRAVKSRVVWLSAISAAATVALLVTLFRIDPVVHGPELSIATSEEPSNSEEPLTVVQEEPLVEIREEPLAKIREETAVAEKNPAMFSIKKAYVRQESPFGLTDSSNLVKPEMVEPRSLRIAEHLSGTSELVDRSTSDRIEPFHIPRVSPNLASLSVAQIAELDLQELFDDYTEEHNISLMSAANAGIRGINKLTGSDISLLASRDEEGDISGFRLKSKRFSVTRPLNREEP
jgi:hypothetical protein